MHQQIVFILQILLTFTPSIRKKIVVIPIGLLLPKLTCHLRLYGELGSGLVLGQHAGMGANGQIRERKSDVSCLTTEWTVTKGYPPSSSSTEEREDFSITYNSS
jgi:hypothetical protein